MTAVQTAAPPVRWHRRRHLLPLPLLRVACALLLLLPLLGASPAAADADLDPYRVLGVSRSSSEQEVKKAYKTQAKLW